MNRFLFLLLSSTVFAANTNTENYSVAKKSSVMILTKVKNGKKQSNYGGAGVVVGGKNQFILTNEHVISKRILSENIACLVFSGERTPFFDSDVKLSAQFHKPYCSVIGVDTKNDLALLKREIPFGPKEATNVKLAKENPKPGQLVHGVFSPSLLPSTFFMSYVNNIFDNPNTGLEGLHKDFNLNVAFGYSAPVSTGASGSMVLNEKNELIGLTFAVLYGPNTGLAIPVSVIQEFISKYDIN